MSIAKSNTVSVVFLTLVVCFSSCKKETKTFDENLLIVPELEGSYRNLDELGIRLFLPKKFTSLDEKDLVDIVNLIPNEERKKRFSAKFRNSEFFETSSVYVHV